MKTLLSSVFATLAFFAASQEAVNVNAFLNPDSPLASYESLSLEISSSSELQALKGWKHIGRWYDMAARHTDISGKAVAANRFAIGLSEYDTFKQSELDGLRSNDWSPAGPFNAPQAISSNLVEGTGRINTITFHPTLKDVMWIGGGQGGLWKTTNGGNNWIPLGDELPVMRVSDITVNEDNPAEMYLCLGDYAYLAYWLETRDVKRNTHFGLGLYRSVDGGLNWSPTGMTTALEEKDASLLRRSFISKDSNSSLVVAGMKGVFTSSDHGDTWNQTLDMEIWDIEQHPQDFKTLYASSGYIRNLDIGTCAMWKSTDFGASWSRLELNIPDDGTAAQRIEIAISPVDPDVVYAVACDRSGGLYGFYRSTDAGESWDLMSSQPNILNWLDGQSGGGQGTYDLAILADPVDVDKVYVGGVNAWVSEDGGASWDGASYYTNTFGSSVHADHHMLNFNPLDSMFYLCHDGGVSRTKEIVQGNWFDAMTDDTYAWPTQWEHLNNGLANLAFYRLDVSQSQSTSTNLLAGAQDMGMFLRDSSRWTYHTLGDGMESIIHPEDPNILYGSSQYGNVLLSYDGGQQFIPLGYYGPSWRDESSEWTTPFMLSPNNPSILYVGGANLWGSFDEGQSFTRFSDLSPYPISAFDISSSDLSSIYLGKRVWYGQDQPGELWHLESDGITWTDISDGTPVDSLYVTYIETDDQNPEIAWATFAGFEPGKKVYETRDGGGTWQNITANLPNLPANCIIQHVGADHNPLYVGMDRGVYYKNDLMDEWELYSEGLPNVIVQDLAIHTDNQELYIATFGRGIWVNNLLDQISTSTLDAEIALADFQIFPNPSKGDINILIAEPGEYSLEIINSVGQVVYHKTGFFQLGPHTIMSSVIPPNGLLYVRLTRDGIFRVRSVLKLD